MRVIPQRIHLFRAYSTVSHTMYAAVVFSLYPLGNILSIEYPLTVIISITIRNVPVIVVLLR